MSFFSARRLTIFAAGLALALGLSSGAATAKTAGEIRAGIDAATAELIATQPGARELLNKAVAVLIIPEVTKGGFIVGGAYGEGALLINNAVDSYWSYGAASFGYQAGIQQTRQAVFFMTDDALATFKSRDGFELGADAEVTLWDQGAEIAVDTTKNTKPTIVVVYGREGLLAGASLQGGKYTKIDR